MNELMRQYIEEQPEIIKKMTDERAEIARRFLAKFGGTKPERIFLFGSGSSYHAARIAQPLMEKLLGIEVTARTPSQFNLNVLSKNPKGNLCFAFSQGGKSASTVLKFREIKAAGAPVIGITENDDTLIAKESDLPVSLRIGCENIGAKTKGLTASALTAILLALEWSRVLGSAGQDFYDRIITDMLTASRQMPENIKRSLDWVEKNKDAMLPAPYMVVLGERMDFGAALEVALKLLETIYRPVVAYEFEEYLHGCQNMLDKKSCLLFLLPGSSNGNGSGSPEAGDRRKYFLSLYEFCGGLGAQAFWISRGRETSDLRGKSGDEKGLVLETAGNDYLSFLELLIPGQVMSARLPSLAGIDISKFKFPDFGKFMDLHIL
jgi:glucoselysine-6-phosphate deglycase